MRKLRGKRWVAGLAGSCLGNRSGVRSTDEEALSQLKESVPPGWITAPGALKGALALFGDHPGNGSGAGAILYIGPRLLTRSCSIVDLCSEFESYQDMLLAATARARFFVQACAVGTEAGAIVGPGGSRAGKTTLARAFIDAGAEYLSDDLAVFDGRGFVHPYPRPLSMRRPGSDQRARVRPEALGGAAGRDPIPVTLVALTHYQPGATFLPEPVGPAEAVFALLGHTLTARVNPRESLAALSSVSTSALVVRGQHGSPADCAAALIELQRSYTVRRMGALPRGGTSGS